MIKSFFQNKCCGGVSKDKRNYDVLIERGNFKNGNIIDEVKNINKSEENKENNLTYKKLRYFEKFKDFDSYNYYAINMDNNDKLFSQNIVNENN